MAVTQAALPVGVPPRAGVGPAPSEPNRSFQHTVGLLAVIALRELRFTGLWFQHELHELLVSRALWAMVLISGPLVGFSFLQSIQLYSGSSLNASRLPQLAANLNPLDGVVIPLFGGVYLMNTFLLPFVAIRMIGNDKQTGALKLILQQPIGPYRVIGVKLAALGVGWVIALLPTISALLIWSLLLGGHLYLPELASVILGHALYAFVIAGFGFLAASLTESSATAAIVALSFTLGAWILEFAGGSGGGIVRAIAAFSLSPALRGLERGLLGSPTALTLFVLGLAFLALTVVWLPPGVSRRQKLFRSAAVVGVGAQALLLAIQLPVYVDVTENHRNSFSAADDAAIRQMNRELRVDVNLAQNDSRLRDLDRQVLSKLQRVAPQVTINFPETSTTGLLGGTSGANYGLVTFTYGGRQVTTRATTAREILPLIHKLAGQDVPPDRTPAYPGYPLVTDASAAGVWFYIIVPLLAVGGWWINQRPPRVEFLERQGLTHPDWLTLHGGTLRRAALIFAGALIVIQVIPYGRDHANIQVSPTDVAYGQICQSLAAGPETVLTLGDLRGQVTAMIGTLDSAVVAPSVAAIRAAYGPLVPRFNGVALDIAQFYPGRCPRLLADRALVETAPQGSALEAQSVVAGVQALRAGLASMGQDLDIRIRQEAPENPLAEDPEETTTPTLTGSPYWNSPRTEELATRACAGCHSNQPNLPWYSNVAPLSWFVQHQVDDGRAALNFSEWDRPQPAVSDAAASVLLGRMPPPTAGAIDKRLALTDAERAELAAGLQASFQNTFPAPPRAAASGSANAPLWLVLGLALAAALFVVGYVGSRRSSRTGDTVAQQV